MVQQGFHIGEREWYVMCFYDIRTRADFAEVERTLTASGCGEKDMERALNVLSGVDGGFTFTNFADGLTLILIGRASSPEQMYDTIQHELKHATEHIGEYFGVDSRSEESAYLQGEIARNMFPAASIVACPRCETAG